MQFTITEATRTRRAANFIQGFRYEQILVAGDEVTGSK
jgi:hypothetical protein